MSIVDLSQYDNEQCGLKSVDYSDAEAYTYTNDTTMVDNGDTNGL